MNVQGKTVVVCVTGSIAAYWAAELVGVLNARGADVRVVMTNNAQKFITSLTLQTISGNPVLTDLFDSDYSTVSHIDYARVADYILIAPATANIIGKIANGIGDDAVSTIVLASKCPVIVCPAMNKFMWSNKIVQKNINWIKKNDVFVVEPEYGYMVCGDVGIGRLASIESILKKIKKIQVVEA